MRFRTIIFALLVAATIGVRAEAQVLAIHAVFVPGTDETRASTGAEIELGGVVSTRFVSLLPTLAVEYQRQHDNGPGRGRVAGQLRVLPRSSQSHGLPYVGVSVSANQSGGEQSEWNGTLGGIQGMAGFFLIPSENFPIALLVEERFGYVRDRNHALATHLGLSISF
jgi:hypothetical protein